MKKVVYILLTIAILGLMTACQNNQDIPNETQTEDSQATDNTQANTKEDDISVETPNYTLTELDIDILQDKETHTLDMVVFDTNVYAIVQILGESTVIQGNDNPYYLVSFDKNGENVTYTALETPDLDCSTGCLKKFSIGQDGNVYALKTLYVDISSAEAEPNYDARVSLVCWNTDGNILYDTKLELLDTELYPDVQIRNLSVSEDGSIFLNCKHLNGGYFIVQINASGSIIEILEDDLILYSATHFKKNNDASLFSIRAESSTESYYIWYDTNTQTLHDEILVSSEIDIISTLASIDEDRIICHSDDGVYQYLIAERKTETLIDFSQSNIEIGYVVSIIPINETDYICIFDNGSMDAIQRIGFLHQVEN